MIRLNENQVITIPLDRIETFLTIRSQHPRSAMKMLLTHEGYEFYDTDSFKVSFVINETGDDIQAQVERTR